MRQTDLIWYARAAVWIGVLLLLVMAFSDRQVAVVSVLAVVGIGLGVIVLIYSIPYSAPGSPRIPASTPLDSTDAE